MALLSSEVAMLLLVCAASAIGGAASEPPAAPAANDVVPYGGVEWKPLGRGDLTWVAEGDSSGLLVGANDGFVRPALSAYAGAWITDHIGAHGSLGIARLTATTWSDGVFVQRHWGVIRPAFDVRVALLSRQDPGVALGHPRPIPWLFLGGHLAIPSARDASNGYNSEALASANQTATTDRLRLGGIGGRLGAGADAAVAGHLHLGLQFAIDWQRTLFRGQDPSTATQWVAAEGALLLEFHWPRPEPDPS